MPIHIDMDAYFASIEQRDFPVYRKKPLVVCHTNDASSVKGIVSTSSYEARKYGVRAAMSVLEAKHLCPQGIFIRGNYQKYLYNTKKIHKICLRFSDMVEIFSVDEFFIDVNRGSHLFSGELKIGLKLQNMIEEELGLSSSVGIGPNKLVAKMASEFKKPRGITIIEEDDLPDTFSPFPVDKLFGVGRKMKKHLEILGINTIGDLANTPEEILKKRFGVIGVALHQAAMGRDFSSVHNSFDLREAVKSFGHSSALGKGVSDIKELNRITLGLTEGITRRMREDGYVGRTITAKLHLARLFSISRSKSVKSFSHLTSDIFPIAKALLEKEQTLIERYPVTTIGISVNNLTDIKKSHQLSIFDLLADRPNQLALTTDSIKNKFGEKSIFRASLLDWKRRYHSVPRLDITR